MGLKETIIKNSPKLLTIGGIIGFGVTAVLVGGSTLKAQVVIKDHKEAREEFEKSDAGDPGTREYTVALAKIYGRTLWSLAKTYAVPIAIGLASTAAILGGHKILSDRNVKLASSLATVTTAYNKLNDFTKAYRKRVVDDQGEAKDKEYALGVKSNKVASVDENGKKTNLGGSLHTDDNVSKKDISAIEGISPYVFVFDERSPEYKSSPALNKSFLIAQQNAWNEFARARVTKASGTQTHPVVILNEILQSLGLDPTPEGALVGWDLSDDTKDCYIDFGITDVKWPENELFLNGFTSTCILDFNCDGMVYQNIGQPLGFSGRNLLGK